nr:hypothetical protein [Tanacetum cinerariifolium]
MENIGPRSLALDVATRLQNADGHLQRQRRILTAVMQHRSGPRSLALDVATRLQNADGHLQRQRRVLTAVMQHRRNLSRKNDLLTPVQRAHLATSKECLVLRFKSSRFLVYNIVVAKRTI